MDSTRHFAGRPVRVGTLPTASGGIARAAYAAAVRAQIDLDKPLKEAGLTLEQVQSAEIRIAVTRQIKFLNELASALHDPYLGIHLAHALDLRELGLLYYVASSSETLGNALARIARYSAIHNEGVRIAYRETGPVRITFEYAGVPRATDCHQIEFIVAIFLRLCRAIVGRSISPSRIRFAHRRKRIPTEVKALFACNVEFGAEADDVAFQLEVKNAPAVHGDPYLNTLLRKYCEEVISNRRVSFGNWRIAVENVVVPLLPHGEATIQNVAARMGTSPRTLARRLTSEKITFGDVLSELRMALAKRYLSEREIKIAEVAWLLGYKEVSAFSHAFKRWTGDSPLRLRSRAEG